MKDRNWIVIYIAVGIFFGLFTGAGLAMSGNNEFNLLKFIFILTGLILLIVLMLLNMKIGKIVQKL
jgi:high-affinity Fe2+/Pb2+ permease